MSPQPRPSAPGGSRRATAGSRLVGMLALLAAPTVALLVLAGAFQLWVCVGLVDGIGAQPHPAAPVRTAPQPVRPEHAEPRAAEPARVEQARTAGHVPATGGFRITVAGWSRTITRGAQATIDQCRATLWQGPMPGAVRRGTSWIAGHDYCGFYRWDKALPVGSRFTITRPSGTVMRYRVFARGYVDRRGGSARGLVKGDVTLQTCRGSGTSFTYARRVR